MNLISTPLIYNYNRVITGLPIDMTKLCNKKILFMVSLFDDIGEEIFKYFLSTKNPNGHFRNNFIDSLLIILLTYPTDIIKNRITYDTPLIICKWDPFIKITHKFLQTLLFFKILNTV